MRLERILTWVAAGLMACCLSCGNNGDGGPTIPMDQPPRAPEDLQVSSTSPGAITLRWRDMTPNETGFRIERSVGAATSFARRDTVPRDVTTYTDGQVEAGQTYYYRVRSFVRSNESEPSGSVWAVAATNSTPAVPTAPDPADRARGIEEGLVTLRWTSTDADAADVLTYDVYFGEVRIDLRLIAGGITETEATIPHPVALSSAYFWRVVVRDPKGAMGISPLWGFNTRVERTEIPAGWLAMGDSEVYPHPGNPVWVDPFEIDRNEVTNQQYAVFLNEALRAKPVPLIRTSGGEVFDPGGRVLFAQTRERDDDAQISYERADSLFLAIPGKENFPVHEVTWQGARAFAEFYGRRLPTEAEWEMAAKGNGTEYGSTEFTVTVGDSSFVVRVGLGQTYPWGNTIDGSYANFLGSGDPFEGQGRVSSTPAGFYDGSTRGGFQTQDGSSPFGIHDMAGNMAEWCDDWYAPYQAPHRPPNDGTLRIIRGGSWVKGIGSLETWRRDYARPYQLGDDSGADRAIGFRTVVSLP